MKRWFRVTEPEPLDYPFSETDIAELHRLRDTGQAAIDDATWKDLLLSQYCAQLSHEVSIFGQQALYQRLRTGMAEGSVTRVKEFIANPQLLEQTRSTCKSLRHADTEIAALLFEEPSPVAPAWAGKVWFLPILLAAAVAASLWYQAALIVVVVLLYFLMANQMRYHRAVEAWARSNVSLQMLLRVVSLRGGEDAARAGVINRGITRSPYAALTPGLSAYQDWFALKNVSHFFRCHQLIALHKGFLQRCFLEIASLEADVALARHLLHTRLWCWSGLAARDAMVLEGAVHPLLGEAQPMTVQLAERGAFISGQNGIGKSTLLRTIGINLVGARAFGFCYASRACASMLPVYSSMQSEDSILGGESLYMAELRRARELLAAADGPHPGVYLIDEIFRGTNHLESVSAAAAVLNVLAAKGLVVVSSHNLMLASLLGHRLAPMCVAKDVHGQLSLSPGVLAHTNGIALLAERGFGAEVEAGAARVFDWLDGYLAHPPHAALVLAPVSEARRA
ncbi:DNA mismatch repair protein MutS [Massilia sp. PAMC28688]|uniref:MutS-related protein n=1 Tax=Massilia sp. PAMC28688 TaxID=2861283 RepID=UPI001C639D96|nr:DNA mismatch repair protein MutS [Massilia sp. PAMC28688]QYF94870.1 DNA mismatch repair protein MutS [Massilia sp. PAMC28688]